MSNALLHGLPLLAVVALIALVYARGAKRAPTYRLPQPWTHPPILWSAIDEPIPAGRPGRHQPDETPPSIGGGASGSW